MPATRATYNFGPVERELPGACPLDCPDGCSWIVTVRDGEAVQLRGNPDHPFTRGALCAKVARYLDHTRTPDRLLHPLRRTGAKGEGRFERISWDDALGEVAERLLAVRERHGGEAIWPFQGTGTLGYLQGLEGRSGARLWNVLGASDHVMSICSIAGSEGLRYTTGSNRGMDPEAFAHARLILLWGSNPLTSHHHIWKFIAAARRQGAHLVVIDPVRTRSAAQADEHLAPRPGTDAALALGLMHEVVRRGAHDEAFLRERCIGWDAYRERIAAFPPERVAEICDLPVERIVALGERLATTRPTAIRATMGIQRHAGGGMALRTLATIPAVTGDWALPGGGLAYSTSGYFRGDRKALVRDDLRPHPVRSLSMTRMGDVLLDADPAVHALVVYGANPLASNPDTGKVRRALAREDLFTVVIEQVPTDTVDYADIVLPSTMQTEHTDVHDGYGHMYLALERARGRAAGRVPAAHRDLPPARTRDGAGGARALRRRPDARAHAGRVGPPDARGRDGRAAAPRGLGAARAPAPARPVRVRLPDAVGQARAVLRARGRRRPRPAAGLHAARRGRRARRGPARPDRRRLALVPELDVRQRAPSSATAPASRPSRCTPTTPPRAA